MMEKCNFCETPKALFKRFTKSKEFYAFLTGALLSGVYDDEKISRVLKLKRIIVCFEEIQLSRTALADEIAKDKRDDKNNFWMTIRNLFQQNDIPMSNFCKKSFCRFIESNIFKSATAQQLDYTSVSSTSYFPPVRKRKQSFSDADHDQKIYSMVNGRRIGLDLDDKKVVVKEECEELMQEYVGTSEINSVVVKQENEELMQEYVGSIEVFIKSEE